MEVESKFNPDDWNGYLHTYETIEEYNAAKKLLPHTARIESTKEAKYIPKGEGLPTRFLYMDRINGTQHGNINNDVQFDECLDDSAYEYMETKYILIGKIQYSGNDYYLWELCKIGNDQYLQNHAIYSKRRYALTQVAEPKLYYSIDGKVYRAKLLTEDFKEYTRMQRNGTQFKMEIDGDSITEVIFRISND